MIKERLDEIKVLKQVREQGGYNGIPLNESFPKLSEYIPSIKKGFMYLFSASSGVGKTQLWKSMIMWTILKFMRRHIETKIKPKIILFLLEETPEEFLDSFISTYLYIKYKIRVDSLEISSDRKHPLSQDIVDKIQEGSAVMEEMLKYIDIQTSVYNATGIYYYCREYSRKNGTHYYIPLVGEGKEITLDEYSSSPEEVRKLYKYSKYVPNDPNEHVIVVVDHISLLNPEKDETLHETMTKWTTTYCRKNMSKHWNYSIICIQQQAGAQENQQFTYSGSSIIAKIKPSLSGLADNKLTQRDFHVVIGLFAPDRYEIKEYEGYNIERLRDNFRTVIVLKNRKGRSNVEIPILFYGDVNHLSELPEARTINEEFYNKIKK